MSTTTLPKQRMKLPEFLAWSERQPDDRYELVDGEVVAVARQETIRHNLDGNIVLDPPGISVSIAALFGV